MATPEAKEFKYIPNHLSIVINKVFEDPESLTDEQIKTLNNEFPVLYGDLVVLRKRLLKLEKSLDKFTHEHINQKENNSLLSKIKEYRGYIITTGVMIITLSSWLIQFVINK